MLEECRKRHADNRERDNIKSRKRRQKNREKNNERSKKYRQEHKEEMKEHNKKYRKTSKGKASCARISHRRRLNQIGLVNDLTAEEFDDIISMQNNICPICRKEFSDNDPPTRDHIIPLTLPNGNPNPFRMGLTKGNVQATHLKCNSKKGNKWDINKALNNIL